MEKIGPHHLQVTVSDELREEIDRYAAIVGVSRSQMMRDMLEISCEGLRPYYKLGVLQKMMSAKYHMKEKLFKTPQGELAY